MPHPYQIRSTQPMFRARYYVLLFMAIALAIPATLQAAGKKKKPVAKKPKASSVPWEKPETIEALYANYFPHFSKKNKAAMAGYKGGGLKTALKFSRQKHFMNTSDVQIDAQVRPIIMKANEMVAKKQDYRKATGLYRMILKQYPEDLFRAADEGIFVPAVLYIQRRILSYPKKELNYYRILFDPAAQEIYRRAVRRYSIPDYKDLVRVHLATSYGDDALFALGNAALDNARYDEARRYYERIIAYHGMKDEDQDKITLDRDHVWARMAICYKHLGQDAYYKATLKHIKNRTESSIAKLLVRLSQMKYDAFAVQQRETRRSARHNSVDDRALSDPMPYSLAANQGEWKAPLARRSRSLEPEVFPWATETDLIYKDNNVLISRSLLTGEINWTFGPGGSSRDWDHYGHRGNQTGYYPRQSILVHDGVVFAHMYVYGPSLVAVDQNTGRLLWAKGSMAATTEDEWLDRYQASAVAGRGTVIVPIVHDDIRGRTHIASTGELAAFESRTGKMVWRRWISRTSPLKITQSRYPRKIRIFSSPPLVKEGVVYHCTNAGVITAVDEQTGDIRWLTRYPQDKNVLDNFSNPGMVWQNDPPLVRGNRLYVTPVDSHGLFCLDTETGKILWNAGHQNDANTTSRHPRRFGQAWRLKGFTPNNWLCLVGQDLVFLDPKTGHYQWSYFGSGGGWMAKNRYDFKAGKGKRPKGLDVGINGEGDDFFWPIGHVHAMPTICKDGKIYFSMQQWKGRHPGSGPFNSDFVLDLNQKGVIDQRRWYDPSVFQFGHAHAPPVSKRAINEETEAFEPSMRMAFSRWETPFEIDITNRHIVVRYDKKKIKAVLAKRNDLDTLFAKAEIARMKGEVKQAIKMYEACKPLLPSEEEDRRRNINLRLFPLYMELARWGHQAVDMALLEHACRNMGATASNPEQEIRALLAYSELHERRGDIGKAIQVLQNASRHYWRENYSVSHYELGKRETILTRSNVAIKNLLGNIPSVYQEVATELVDWESSSLSNYFLSVANVQKSKVVEIRSLIARRIKEVLKRAPQAVRDSYEKKAAVDLARYPGIDVGERLLWCWPKAKASQQKLNGILQSTGKLPGRDQKVLSWRLDDMAQSCDLTRTDSLQQNQALLKRAPLLSSLSSGSGNQSVETKNEDPDMARLVLPQRGHPEATAGLLFVGGRKRRAYGNRFSVTCLDLASGKKSWVSREILLKGQTAGGEGYEVGFEEVFVHGPLAIVHGRYDVVAINWKAGKELRPDGKKKRNWHFRVPVGFEIRSMDLCGELLILNGRSSTLGLSAKTGEIMWDAPEIGEFYAGPYFHKGVVLSVRKSPAVISFRNVGSGRLISRLFVPGLSTNTKHPVYSGEGNDQNPAAAESAEASPVAYHEGVLAVTDGLTYHVIDVETQKIRWSERATKLDPSVDSSYRMWINNGKLLVLKPYYSVLENVVFDLESGERIWRRREGGKKQDKALKKFAATDSAGGKAATGLILSSMTFLDNKAYGIKYQMNGTVVTLVGMDPTSGNELIKISVKGFADPEAYVERSWSKDCVVVRIQDGNKFELWQVNVKTKTIVQRIKSDGYGRLGAYGDASAVWQGPHLAIWTFEKRKISRSK